MRTVCGGAVCGSLPSLKKMGRHDMESTAIARSPVAMREPAGCISKRMLLLAVLMLAGAAEAQYQTVVGGSWELVVQQGGVSAMHMFLTRADTVVYFDRTDNGPSQALLPDGQCRNNPRDLALKVDCYAHSMEFNIASNQVRPLFVFSDTWCSSGAFMANGSMVQTGGYNDGEKTVRQFTPCSDATCDWVELPPTEAALTAKRWYATNHVLPSGDSQIVVGGTGAFTYEFVPRPSSQKIFFLQFLRDTFVQGIQNNLYPFVFLIPDGNLFMFANNQSILFDYNNHKVVRTYPALESLGGGRNYPSTGSAVLLPLNAKERFRRAEVLVCGGAPNGAVKQAAKKVFVPALNTCGRLTVTDPAPVWRIETMPNSWVLNDMVLLPTQEVLLINGAQSGVAGWNMAENPVLNPVLYRPNGALGSRFTRLEATSIPRMYHSTAVLLPDARILVAGSNTHAVYTFSGPYPTELRIEAYSPYFLRPNLGFSQARNTSLSNSTPRYGTNITVVFNMARTPIPNRFAVSLYAPPFATHSFSQNQRLLVLARTDPVVSGGGYITTVTLPASNVHCPSGYYLLFIVHDGVPSYGSWVQVT